MICHITYPNDLDCTFFPSPQLCIGEVRTQVYFSSGNSEVRSVTRSLLACYFAEVLSIKEETRQLCKERKSMMKWAQCVHITYHAKTIRRNLSTVKCFVNVNVSVFMCEQIKPPLAANTHLLHLHTQRPPRPRKISAMFGCFFCGP